MPLLPVVPELVSDINLKRARTEDDQGNTCIRVKGETSTDLTPITETLGEKDDSAYSGSGDGTVVTLLKGIYNVFGNTPTPPTPTPSWEPQYTTYFFMSPFDLDGPGENIVLPYEYGKFVLNARIELSGIAFSGDIDMSFTMPFDQLNQGLYPSYVTKTETFVDWQNTQSITVTVSFMYSVTGDTLTINGNYDYCGIVLFNGLNQITAVMSPTSRMLVNTVMYPSFIYNYQ